MIAKAAADPSRHASLLADTVLVKALLFAVEHDCSMGGNSVAECMSAPPRLL